MRIAAVVVTYNRIKYLKKCIAALLEQTYPLDAVFVIDNGSTDGTKEWLDCQKSLIIIHQDNVGGAGGFYRGLMEANRAGYEYVWAMDDDVHPTPSCLEQMIAIMPERGGIVCPQRLMDGKTFISETKHFNLTNPFKSLKIKLTETDIEKDVPVLLEDMAFEGPLISSSVISEIGLPEKGLFIFWDDSEYAYRAFSSGFDILYAPKAILIKENMLNGATSVGRSWKYPYMLRNEVFFVQKYGKSIFKYIYTRKLFIRYFLGVIKHLIKRDGKYTLADLQLCRKAFHNGMHGILGKFED